MGKKKKKKGLGINDERVPKLFGVLCLVIAAYLLIAFTSYLFTWQADQDKVLEWNWRLLSAKDLEIENWLGRLGAVVSNLFFYWGFGLPSFLLIPILTYLGLALIRSYTLTLFWERLRNGFLMVVGTSILLEFILRTTAFPVGGAFGDMISTWLIEFVGTAGLIVLLIALAVVVIVLNINPDFKEMTVNSALKDSQDYMKERWYTAWSGKPKTVLSNPLKQKKSMPAEAKVSDLDDEIEEIPEVPPVLIPPAAPVPEKKQLTFALDETIEQPTPKIHQPVDAELEIETVSIESILEEPVLTAPVASPLSSQLDKVQTGADLEPYDPTLDLPSFEQPVLALLNEYSDQKFEVNREELEAKKDQIIETLLNYKIEIQSVKAVVGPTVTLFKVKPAPGVRISKIKSLEDDIALSLSALGIRIIAPIPGEGVIGIEVPNEKKQIVSLKEVLASETFKRSKMQLPIAFGKTISNQVFVADLAKMPHLLIAGATGQGKSVGINVVLMSLLYQKHPSQVKLVLIDPKKVELSPYAKLENHFLSFLPGS
ncbi:MAG: DNA translocase FtsK, partial [Saprospiraceae bacterium]|nr:DNA translocase FtsK [Saprospiraceae bacterium]